MAFKDRADNEIGGFREKDRTKGTRCIAENGAARSAATLQGGRMSALTDSITNLFDLGN